MENFFKLAFLPGLVALVITFLATPVVSKLAGRLGIIDDPAKNNHEKVLHTYPTPRGGGISIFLGILVALLLFLPLDKHLKGFLLGATIIVIVGFLDDKYNLNPYLRLGLNFLA